MTATTTEARGRDKQGAEQAERVPPRLKEIYHAEVAPALRT